ncbi:MAG: insulinase family protein, partial [Bdellovibrionales bacterium]|nr:insulinase family protein [Bdellovibrionales bacterium]
MIHQQGAGNHSDRSEDPQTFDELKPGQTLRGWKLANDWRIDDIRGRKRVLEHEKTGMQIQRFDMPFVQEHMSIIVKNLSPTNSKGLCHIGEHVVCSGGANTQLKNLWEVFMNSSSGSVFACTTSDYTRYNVASEHPNQARIMQQQLADACFNLRLNPDDIVRERGYLQPDSSGETERIVFEGT